MVARRLQSLGAVLVALGLAAHLFGWDWLLWVPRIFVEAVRSFIAAITWDPLTYGVIAAGVVLIVVGRFVARR